MTPRAVVRRRLAVASAALVLAAGACRDSPAPSGLPAGSPGTAALGDRGLSTVTGGKLTACISVPDAPFAFEEDGELDGIDIELVRALAGRLKLAPAFVQVNQDDVLGHLDDGKCDLAASSLTITPERQATYEFSRPYFQVDQSLLVRRGDETRFADLAGLQNMTIGVVASSTGAAYARANAPGATLEEFDGPDELLTALASGKLDAALQDAPLNAYDAKTTGETVLVKTFSDGDKELYGLALRKGRTALAKTVDDALAQVLADDTYPTILRSFLDNTDGRV